MRNSRESRKIVEKVIRDVYRQTAGRRSAALGDTWKADVLRRVRALPQAGGQPPLAWLFQLYLWRMAPVACVLIIFMTAWLSRGGLSPDIEMAALTLDNPLNVSLIDVMGR